jgi:Flp pilus assembly protein TadG
MVLLFAVLLLIFNAGWGVFVKATLQHAVAEGCRYAITGQTSGTNGQKASIVSIVQNQAMGLLSGSQAGTISVTFYNPETLAMTASNAQGNLVQVSVVGYQLTPWSHLLYSSSPISITATATDIIEPSPNNIAPPL